MWLVSVKRIWGWVVKKFKRGEAERRVEWSPLPDPREVALLWADERLPRELKHLLLKAYGLCPCCDTYRPLVCDDARVTAASLAQASFHLSCRG